MTIREDADCIIQYALSQVQPEKAVRRALANRPLPPGRIVLVAIGKAAWQMAATATEILGSRLSGGIVITKYGHSRGVLPPLLIREAGHPIPDENTFHATREACELISGLTVNDLVLFLVSGGGSALFEDPLIPPADLFRATEELLTRGADIREMNTIRKRFSAVKGGKFALLCQPAAILNVVLSDILGDPLDMIASGPTFPDTSTCEEALSIARKYQLSLTEEMVSCLKVETPKALPVAETIVGSNVRTLCEAASTSAASLGYQVTLLTDCLDCEAREAGRFLGVIARSHQNTRRSLAFLAGGETVVHITGSGLGGRNQELVLAASLSLPETQTTAIFSFGSDGTDGPTDAAGGYVDSESFPTTEDALAALAANDSYHALKSCGGLILTGPTGTNVNDLAVILIKR